MFLRFDVPPIFCDKYFYGLMCYCAQENCLARKDMIAMEKAIAERLGYLQRYKVVLTTDVSLAVDIALYIMLHFCDSIVVFDLCESDN